MNFAAALRSAWRALATNLMRSILTMLGIIIGVAAVITMIAVGGGAQERVAEQIRSLGSNVILLTPGSRTATGVRLGSGATNTLTEGDAQAIAREVPEIKATAPQNRTSTQVVAQNANWPTQVLGTTNDYFSVREWNVVTGRSFDPAELARGAKVAVLGQTVVRELFGDDDPIDQLIRVNRVPMTVIGVLDRKGQNAFGQDQDDVVIVPLSTFRNRLQGRSTSRLRTVASVTVQVHEGQSMEAAEAGMRELLRQRHRLQPDQPDDFSIRNLTEVLAAQEASTQVMTLLLAAVAGVSLIVGGIGIMNIMLVSVTERTREIGLRMAVGARSGDILAQFLIEAVTLSLVGGAIGIVLGAAATWAVAFFAEWQVMLSVKSIVLAAGFSAAVGVFFGFYPARRAAALLPIQALRHE
ncbi:ABC transporter permease [Caldimonas brevitalea]|uniref:Multidrug ABC transporter substrate-binding protein n=1 Tax=Caldimonas brevitalea TaxID=413882 RepID=A0A0G3BK18_9BURK|nr:ABC transporter permease [Caldimonas brevitalea]AKJ28308.1 multidrug ABC transporter substrate-binding protein [Caldimonas brevitalea]